MKTRTSITLMLSLIAILFLSNSLNAQNEEVEKIKKDLPKFNKIEVNGVFNIEISQQSVQDVEIQAIKEVADQVELIVEKDKLKINNKANKIALWNNNKNTNNVKICIGIPNLSEIECNGVCKISSKGELNFPEIEIESSGASAINLNFNSNKINCDVSGVSSIELTGKTNILNIDISGTGNINAKKLLTETTIADLSGVSKVSINSKNIKKVDISVPSKLINFYGGNKVVYSKNKSNYETSKLEGDSFDNDFNEFISVDSAGNVKHNANTFKKQDKNIKDNDTVRVKVGNIKVEVVNNEDTKVSVGNNSINVNKDGIKFNKNNKKKYSKYNGHWNGIEIGVNGLIKDNGFLDLRHGKSINFKVNFLEQNFNLISNKLGLTSGVGFEWNNYRFSDNNLRLVKKDNKLEEHFLSEPNVHYEKSKLVLAYFNVPLILEFQTNRYSNASSFHLGIGLNLGWMFTSYAKYKYREENNNPIKVKDRQDFYTNSFKYELVGRFGWNKLNFHVNYGLNPLFKTGKAAKMHPITFGITLLEF